MWIFRISKPQLNLFASEWCQELFLTLLDVRPHFREAFRKASANTAAASANPSSKNICFRELPQCHFFFAIFCNIASANTARASAKHVGIEFVDLLHIILSGGFWRYSSGVGIGINPFALVTGPTNIQLLFNLFESTSLWSCLCDSFLEIPHFVFDVFDF